MKIIDEKGRLFGKLNLIDLLVILVALAAVFVLIWKLGGKKAAENLAAKPQTVRFTVLVQDVPEEICKFAETQVGASLVNNGKVLNAVITDAETVPAESGCDLYVTVDAEVSYSEYVYKVGTQEVRVGYEYILKTTAFELTGVISDLEVADG